MKQAQLNFKIPWGLICCKNYNALGHDLVERSHRLSGNRHTPSCHPDLKTTVDAKKRLFHWILFSQILAASHEMELRFSLESEPAERLPRFSSQMNILIQSCSSRRVNDEPISRCTQGATMCTLNERRLDALSNGHFSVGGALFENQCESTMVQRSPISCHLPTWKVQKMPNTVSTTPFWTLIAWSLYYY